MNQKELRYDFIRYLQENYAYARPDIMASNVFYAWRHYIGMYFWEIFRTEESMQSAQKFLIHHFEETGRKDPKGHAGVHYGCWQKFKEFLERYPTERMDWERKIPPAYGRQSTDKA